MQFFLLAPFFSFFAICSTAATPPIPIPDHSILQSISITTLMQFERQRALREDSGERRGGGRGSRRRRDQSSHGRHGGLHLSRRVHRARAVATGQTYLVTGCY